MLFNLHFYFIVFLIIIVFIELFELIAAIKFIKVIIIVIKDIIVEVNKININFVMASIEVINIEEDIMIMVIIIFIIKIMVIN